MGSPSLGKSFFTDRRSLLTVFPEEVWLLIFEKVDTVESDDLQNLSNSSPYLGHLLSPQRVNFLFKVVWKVLERKYAKDYCDNVLQSGGRDIHPAKVYKNQVLNLRLVSRSWCRTIDNFYQYHPAHYKLEDHFELSDGTPGIPQDLNPYSFSRQNPARVSLFLRHFDQSHGNSTTRNPFLGRRFETDVSMGDHDHFEGVSSLLLSYGQHIWYCHLSLIAIDSFAASKACYSRMKSVLQQMPNLRIIYIYYYPPGEAGDSSEETLAQRLHQFRDEIMASPLPTLEHLRMITMYGVLSPLMQGLLRSNGHVDTLCIRSYFIKEDPDIYTTPLPNLKSLSIQFHSEPHFVRVVNDLGVDWTLGRLHLDLSTMTDSYIDFDEVFSVIQNRFRNTLQYLQVKMPVLYNRVDKSGILRCRKEGDGGHNSFQLDLPHLVQLSITTPNLPCLDHLLPLANTLEIFHLRVRMVGGERELKLVERVETEQKTIIKFFNCARRPLESNIWFLFPQLEKVIFSLVHADPCDDSSDDFDEDSDPDTRIFWVHTRDEWKSKTCVE